MTESTTLGLVSAGTSHDFGAQYTYRNRDYGVRVTVARMLNIEAFLKHMEQHEIG